MNKPVKNIYGAPWYVTTVNIEGRSYEAYRLAYPPIVPVRLLVRGGIAAGAGLNVYLPDFGEVRRMCALHHGLRADLGEVTEMVDCPA